MNNWLSQTLKEVQDLGDLPSDWDDVGEPASGASDIDDDIIKKVSDFLQFISERICCSKPNVVPISGGWIQLEWRKDDFYFEIEFIGNKMNCLLKKGNKIDTNTTNDPEVVLNYLKVIYE